MDDKPSEDSKSGKIINFPGVDSVHDEIGVGSYATPLLPNAHPMAASELMDPRQVALELKERVKYVQDQELVTATKAKASTKELVDVLVAELAEEISHLKWERREAARKGLKTEKQTLSRISGLKHLADILMKRRETLGDERLSTKDPRVQQFFKLWMEMFFSAMEKVSVPSEVIDLVFSQVKVDMLEWEIKMESMNAKS